MEVRFLGAAGTVTGSRYLVSAGGTTVLVDCGLFQGLKTLRLRNWEAPPFDPAGIDAVVLSHAHLDHSGALPLLVRRGFHGPIHATGATVDLAAVLLEDSAHLQEEDARRANRRRYSRHDPALALYTAEDVAATLPFFARTPARKPFRIGALTVTLVPAGHILGACGVRVEHEGRVAWFSGDVGRPNDLLMRPPDPFTGADLLVLEGTYGNRVHPTSSPHEELAAVVNEVCGRGGVLVVPSFAVGRAQALLHVLAELTASGAIPRVPTYLNSPMAIDATEIFTAHPNHHRLTQAQCASMCRAAGFVRDVEGSKVLNERSGPMILIAGSGMATGGRVLHHLARFGPDPNNGILLVGFQAAGTRGEALREGAESLKIHGEQVPIRATVRSMNGLSGHADWRELVEWLRGSPRPGAVAITHAEPAAADALRVHLRDELGWDARVAVDGGAERIG